ncbi:MAG: type II toxin-antitoxin system RelE/ParE family toxin [Thermoplasmata archaeon]
MGKYSVIYAVNSEEGVIHIVTLGHRKAVYRRMGR